MAAVRFEGGAGAFLILALALAVVWVAAGGPLSAAAGSELIWIRQFGTAEGDGGYGIAVHDSGLYLAGLAGAALPGQTGIGSSDAFIRRYSPDGNEVWTLQFGTSSYDDASRIAIDTSGIYVAGITNGAFPGFANAGYPDIYLRKYDFDRNVLWTQQFGTAGGEAASDMALDGSGLYLGGSTLGAFPGYSNNEYYDGFVRKYDLAGNAIWTRQFATERDTLVDGLAVDASGLYVAGSTWGAFPGFTNAGDYDAYLRKYDFDGNVLWTRQFGTMDLDGSSDVAADASGPYLVGSTLGTLPGQTSTGGPDVFVRKYEENGDEAWTRQFGTATADWASCVTVDASGISVCGYTHGSFPGFTNSGESDIFLRSLGFDGSERWTFQFGTTDVELASEMAVGFSGVYVTGTTRGAFPGSVNAGSFDAFVAKVGAPSEDLPPVLSVPQPIIAEATGPSGAKVDFVATAEDDVDGSLTPDCSPASGSVFPLGTTMVTCMARDSAGNQATATFTVEVRDSRPPVLTVPTDIQVEATGPSGAAVTFEVTATDVVDPSPTLSCSPPSGSIFAIGTTTVTCTAMDSAGNPVTASFNVTVTEIVGPSGFDLWPFAAASVVVAIGVVVAAVVAFTRRKRKGRGPSGGAGGAP